MSSGASGVYNRQQSRVKTVAIAIPSLHRPDLTARCLEVIQHQTMPAAEWEVVVIENEAQPDSILPDPLPANTRRIELPANEGTTGSINRAVVATESRYVLLLNNDVELQPDYLEKLVRALDADSKLGFATGKLLRATQRTHLDGAGDAMLLAGAAYRLGHFDRDDGQYDRVTAVLSGCGAAVLYRREVFELCGRLDEDFFAYLDDLDLALRAQLLGHAGIYLPNAVAYHVGSATLGDVLHPRIVEYLTRNQIYLLAKDYPRSVFWRLLPRIAVYQGLWLIYATRKHAFAAWLRGSWAGLRGWGRMRRKRRELLVKRRISDDDFLARLRESERQIYDWQQSADNHSGLLTCYFRLFGKP
jgi:GT2 family glycosyltransferase